MWSRLGTPVSVIGCLIDPSFQCVTLESWIEKLRSIGLKEYRVRVVGLPDGSVSKCLPCTHKDLSVQCPVPMFIKKLVEHCGTHL